MPLPYERATTGKKALGETQALLRSFGATHFGVMEDMEGGVLTLQFAWRDRRVTVSASAQGWAVAWLKQNPWSARRRVSEKAHQRAALAQGNIAVYSMLRDWVKGQVTAVESGMLSFEGAFLGQIMLPNGQTVLERLAAEGTIQIAAGPELPKLAAP